MGVYVIIDDGGNYVSNLSFQAINNGWLYWSLTGITEGFKSWANKEMAEKIKSQLLATSQKLLYSLRLFVKEVNK
jgi:hypothetical protein